METIFDLREFLLKLYQKVKKSITLIVALGILGATYGGITSESNTYVSQSAASVNITSHNTNETDGIDIVMGNIRETISSNFFYMGILNEINVNYSEDEVKDLFKKQLPININDLREILNIYTSGNTIIVELKATNSVTAQKFSNSIRETTVKKIAQNINNITITIQDQYVYNQMLETGDVSTQRMIKYGLVAILGGLVIIIFYSFFFDIIDTKVKTTKDLKKFNLPILGEISEGEDTDD